MVPVIRNTAYVFLNLLLTCDKVQDPGTHRDTHQIITEDHNKNYTQFQSSS